MGGSGEAAADHRRAESTSGTSQKRDQRGRYGRVGEGSRTGERVGSLETRLQEHVRDGYTWVVDIDLEKFFDRVNHDVLMARVARKVKDKRILRLLRRYLESGVMINGVCVTIEEGTPQGGPIIRY